MNQNLCASTKSLFFKNTPRTLKCKDYSKLKDINNSIGRMIEVAYVIQFALLIAIQLSTKIYFILANFQSDTENNFKEVLPPLLAAVKRAGT